MLSGMKPLPKALIIFVPIALLVWAGVKFMPEKKVEPVVAPVAVQVVPAEDPVVTKAAQRLQAPIEAPASVIEAPVQKGNVTSGDAGMDALLNAGKKK